MSNGEPETADETVEAWLDALAATGPNPGGGAAAAVMAGMAAALAEMVLAYRADKRPHRDELRTRRNRAVAGAVRRAAPSMADRDTAASAGFAAASAAEAGASERQAAGEAAAEASAALGDYVTPLVPVLRELANEVGMLLLADVGVAASALAASVRTAALNICADLHWAGGDTARRPDLLDAVDHLHATAAELEAIASAVAARLRSALQPGAQQAETPSTAGHAGAGPVGGTSAC